MDLKKAFDKVSYSVLFQALAEQWNPAEYVTLLARLYDRQQGVVEGVAFPVCRGVRQGDILSPALFNAALELAMRRWKARLQEHGFLLALGADRLTNLRYADDLLIFGKSMAEVVEMY